MIKKLVRKCKAALAIRCKILIVMFFNHNNFTKKCIIKIFKKYYRNAKYLIKYMFFKL